MLKRGVFSTLKAFVVIFLASIVKGDENFLVNDVDCEGWFCGVPYLKEVCMEYPNLRMCHYWNYPQEEIPDENPHYSPATTNSLRISNKSSQELNQPPENFHPELTIEPSYLNLDKPPVEKRFNVFRRRNPNSQSYKRGPGFRSWGGKRDPNFSEGDLEKRTKFTSWGGKRDESYLKEEDDDVSDNSEEVTNEKRTKFTSWGGKRDDVNKYQDLLTKKSKFRSWGGKREGEEFKRDVEAPISYDQAEKRDPFWNSRTFYTSEPFKKHVPKRPQFQSWGGKRAIPWLGSMGYYYLPFFPIRYNQRKLISGGEKRKFSNWGGKRYEEDYETEKRFEQASQPFSDQKASVLKTRHVFQNWGGKRTSQENDKELSQDNENMYDLLSKDNINNVYKNPKERKKREAAKDNDDDLPLKSRVNFNAWGGKREENQLKR